MPASSFEFNCRSPNYLSTSRRMVGFGNNSIPAHSTTTVLVGVVNKRTSRSVVPVPSVLIGVIGPGGGPAANDNGTGLVANSPIAPMTSIRTARSSYRDAPKADDNRCNTKLFQDTHRFSPQWILHHPVMHGNDRSSPLHRRFAGLRAGFHCETPVAGLGCRIKRSRQH
jgi:hypothetical protein